MAEVLIDAGADVNARSKVLGFVPLHEVRTVRMIEYLLRHGANPGVKNEAGQTPMEYLREDDCLEEAEYLRQRMPQGKL